MSTENRAEMRNKLLNKADNLIEDAKKNNSGSSSSSAGSEGSGENGILNMGLAGNLLISVGVGAGVFLMLKLAFSVLFIVTVLVVALAVLGYIYNWYDVSTFSASGFTKLFKK